MRPPAAACDARMSDRKPPSRLRQVLALGSTQTLAWASSTYLPAILALPIARDLDISRSTVFGAFSVSLVVMALAGPAVGRTIDRNGGRGVLASSNLVLAAGLVLLGLASNVVLLFAAWCVLGLGMAMGLYDAAFATLVSTARARGKRTDHRNYAYRGFRQHCGVAAYHLCRGALRLARKRFRLGGAAPLRRPAA